MKYALVILALSMAYIMFFIRFRIEGAGVVTVRQKLIAAGASISIVACAYFIAPMIYQINKPFPGTGSTLFLIGVPCVVAAGYKFFPEVFQAHRKQAFWGITGFMVLIIVVALLGI